MKEWTIVAALMSGLDRIAFVQKKYSDAERWYGDVVSRFANSHFAPEAMYWRAVAQYSASHDVPSPAALPPNAAAADPTRTHSSCP
jgi:hypothetical protein